MNEQARAFVQPILDQGGYFMDYDGINPIKHYKSYRKKQVVKLEENVRKELASTLDQFQCLVRKQEKKRLWATTPRNKGQVVEIVFYRATPNFYYVYFVRPDATPKDEHAAPLEILPQLIAEMFGEDA